jgi:hypothetical protein
MTEPKRNQEPEFGGIGGCLIRVFWLIAGPVALVGAAICLFRYGDGAWAALSAGFWTLVLLMIGLRYLDITRFHGTTADDQPASLGDWKRYSVKLLVISAALWFAAVAMG